MARLQTWKSAPHQPQSERKYVDIAGVLAVLEQAISMIEAALAQLEVLAAPAT